MRTVLLGGFSLFCLSITPSASADPQNDALEALAACRAIKPAAVRLACMDAATEFLEETNAATVAPPTPPEPTAPVSAPEPVAPASDPALVAAAEAAAVERAAIAAEREALAAERAALESERAAIETAAIAPTPEADSPSLLERLTPGSSEPVDFQIVKIVRLRPSGDLRFFTDEGVILDQAANRINFRAPSTLPAAATMSFGVLGSKWLTLAEHPRRKYKVSIRNRD